MKVKELNKRREQERKKYDGLTQKEYVEKNLKRITNKLAVYRASLRADKAIQHKNPEYFIESIKQTEKGIGEYLELRETGKAIIQHELNEEREAYGGQTEKEYYAGINRGVNNFVNNHIKNR